MIYAKEFKYEHQNLFCKCQFEAHIKLYRGYVNNANNAKYSPSTYDLNGIMLHELFFMQFTEPQANYIDNTIYNKIDFEKFENEALKARGWVIWGYEPISETWRDIVLSSHNDGLSIYFEPVLIIDCYEHSYFMQYRTDKSKYIADFIKYVNKKFRRFI